MTVGVKMNGGPHHCRLESNTTGIGITRRWHWSGGSPLRIMGDFVCWITHPINWRFVVCLAGGLLRLIRPPDPAIVR